MSSNKNNNKNSGFWTLIQEWWKKAQENKIINPILIGITIIGFVVVVGIFVFLFVRWDNNDKMKITKIIPPEKVVITYGNGISFDDFQVEVERGSQYEPNAIKVSEDEEALALISKSKIEYDKNLIGIQKDVTLTYDDKKYSFDLEIEPVKLAQPSIQYKGDNKIVWSQIEHVSKYQLIINGETKETEKAEYDLGDYVTDKQQLEIVLKAVSDDVRFESSESELCTLEKLSKPSEIKYMDGKFSWTSVEGSAQYNVSINGESKIVNTNELEYSLVDGENKIEIIAKSTKDKVIDSNLAEMIFTQLAPVSNIRYEDGEILWDSSNINCAYCIKIDGKEERSDSASYSYLLESGKEYKIEIQAVSKEENDTTMFSSTVISQIIKLDMLETPIVKVQQGKSELEYIISFLPIENAINYTIEVIECVGKNETTISKTTENTKISHEIQNSNVDKLIVQVKANSNTGKYKNSNIGEKIVEIEHIKLKTPTVTIADGEEKNSYIITYPKVTYANSYQIEIIYKWIETNLFGKNPEDKEQKEEPYITKDSKIDLIVPKDIANKKNLSIEVRVTAINESGMHENSDSGVAIKEVE